MDTLVQRGVIVVIEGSNRMMTMITPFGRYRWQRLPFGLKVSSEVFQKRLTDALCDLEGVVCVADAITVVGGLGSVKNLQSI